jgi:hypothetical protein
MAVARVKIAPINAFQFRVWKWIVPLRVKSSSEQDQGFLALQPP